MAQASNAGQVVVLRCPKCGKSLFRVTRDEILICAGCNTSFAKGDWLVWK